MARGLRFLVLLILGSCAFSADAVVLGIQNSGGGGGGGAVNSVNGRTGTVTLVNTDIPVFVGSGASHAVGTVPDPGASAGTTHYLREDGSWSVPPGGGGGVTALNSLTGSLSVVAGTGITVTPSGSNITIAATGGGGGVSSVNTRTGAVTLTAADIPSNVPGSLMVGNGTTFVEQAITGVITMNSTGVSGFASGAFNSLSPMTTLGDTIYGGASGAGTRLAGNASATPNVLISTGTGSTATAPVWGVLTAAMIPSLPASVITSGQVGTAQGGTGLDGSAATNGQILIGTGTGFALSTLTAGGNVTITNSSGGITIAATAASGVSSLNSLTGALNVVAGSGITVTPSGSSITVAATGAGSPQFPDNTFAVQGNVDATKQFKLSNSGMTTGTTLTLAPTQSTSQTLTVPNLAAGDTLVTLGSAPVMTSEIKTVASTTGTAGLNLPHGAAPTSPSNGDLWTTTAGIYARINGVTVGPLVNGAPTPDVQVYNTAGSFTWTKPAGVTIVRVRLIGGGGGGASGAVSASGTSAFGGGGAAQGTFSEATFRAADCGATETVVCGAGGAGGAGQTTNSTSGVNGVAGGNSTFGTITNGDYAQAYGGSKGLQGTTTTGNAGGVGISMSYQGVQGGNNGSNAAPAVAPVQPAPQGGGGGGGGGVNTTPTAFAGGNGTAGSIASGIWNVAGGAGGAINGGAGTAGANAATLTTVCWGAGGGGSGGGTTANSLAGGAGGKPGGGGGGSGGVLNGFTSGAGGAGAPGIVVVESW